MYKENGVKPACFSNKCEIVDIAPDIELNQIINSYLAFKRLGTTSGYIKVQEKFLERSGLSDEPDLLLAFESIFDEALERRREIKQAHSKAKQDLKGINKRGSLRR